LHVIARPARERGTPRVAGSVAHVSRRAEAVLEQPRLDVEAVRIDGSVRTFETHDEPPALAGSEDGGFTCFVAFRPRRVPGERQPRGHRRAGRLDVLDGERESRPERSRLRQVVDDADERDVDAFPRRGERIGETDVGAPRRVAEPEGRAGGGGDDGRGKRAGGPRSARACAEGERRERKRRAGAEPLRRRRQAALPLQQNDPAGERGERERQR
jgi:hypothetical protein